MGKVTKKYDLTKFEDVVELLKNKKTTIETTLSRLQDMVENFQHIKEDYYIEEFRDQVERKHIDPEEIDAEVQAGKIEKLVIKDTKLFVDQYVSQTNDKILDAVNDKTLPKESAFAYLMLIQIMQQAFQEEHN